MREKNNFFMGSQRNMLHKLWPNGEKLNLQLAKRNLSAFFLLHKGPKL